MASRSAPARPSPSARPPGVPMRRPVHPGRFLARNVLTPMQLSQSEAARRLGISRRRVNELVMGHRAMSADTAIRCALAFGLPASMWLALQSDWDCWQAWQLMRSPKASQRPLPASLTGSLTASLTGPLTGAPAAPRSTSASPAPQGADATPQLSAD